MPGKTRDENGKRKNPARTRTPPTWVVTRRDQPQGEENLRWVQLTLARNLWMAHPPFRPAG